MKKVSVQDIRAFLAQKRQAFQRHLETPQERLMFFALLGLIVGLVVTLTTYSVIQSRHRKIAELRMLWSYENLLASLEQADRYLFSEQWSLAEARLLQILKNDVDRYFPFECYQRLGQIYLQRGAQMDTRKAYDAYEKALTVYRRYDNPDDIYNKRDAAARVMIRMARCLYREKTYTKSIHVLEQMITEFPQSPDVGEAKLFIGQCYDAMGDFVEAMSHYYRLVATTRDTHLKRDAYVGIAEILKERSQEVFY